ncbi:UPF3 [Auxenochlorella protothecoides x Auxenochlorella symbiontica]
MTQAEERTKVVVRHLPPSLSEDAFKSAVQEWLDRSNWSAYYQGKVSAKEHVHSRAYLNFKDPADALRFSAAFNGNLFVSDRGAHTRAQVEYAPFQRVPRATNRRDPREGTIEKDAGYRAFLKSLDEETQTKPSALPAPQPPMETDALTPLVLFLKEKRAKDKLKAAAVAAAKKGGKGPPAAKTAPQVQLKQQPGGAGKQGTATPEVSKPARGKKAAKGAAAAQDAAKSAKAKPGDHGKPGAVPKEAGPGAKNAGKKAGAPGGAQAAEASPASLPKQKKAPVTIQMIKRVAPGGGGKAEKAGPGLTQLQGQPLAPSRQRAGSLPSGNGEATGAQPQGSRDASGGAARTPDPSRRNPTAILKRAGAGATGEGPQPAPDLGAAAAPAAAPAGKPGAEPAPSTRGGKPVRVREGFQAFQPKRVGRLTEGSGATGAGLSPVGEERSAPHRPAPRKKKVGQGDPANPGLSAEGKTQAAAGG